MSGKKGQKYYPNEIKQIVVERIKNRESQKAISKDLGISRYAIQSWCGLRSEVNTRQQPPLFRGRPRKEGLPPQQSIESELKRLRMENELLRDFLRLAGRK